MFKKMIGASTKPIRYFILTIFSISTLNWIGIQFLANYCTSFSLFGPIKNIFSMSSPLCMYVNHTQLFLADYYIIIWKSVTFATIAWISSRFSKSNNKIPK